ncbi:prion-inhibition and propagation-domain-containing protein, partial [Diaporthe sp. PMI_573]
MEPVGLTVGVIGLAGLFSSCLEAVDKVQTYRSFGSDSHVLDTRFKAAKVRLEKWGRGVGFNENALSEDHQPALDDRDIFTSVQDIFQIITTVCGASDTSIHPSNWAATPGDDVSLGSLRPRPHIARRRKLTWALRGKTARTDQVELFEKLVQQLHNLVPVDTVQGSRPVRDKLASGLGASGSSPDHAWPAELKRILARIEEANEAETRRELHSWLGRWSPNERYHDSVQTRLVGTCDWIFHRPAFQNWLNHDFPAGAKLLWINGPAGFGKTILCAHVVEHLSSTLERPVAHFFFSSDLESREDPFVAVRSWISQVVSQHEGAFEHVRQRWEADSDPVATRANAVMLFTQLLHVVPGCTFVVDGLDECTYLDNSNTSVTRFLHTVTDAVVGMNTRVLVVSRAEPEIRHAFTDDALKSFAEYEISLDDVRSDTAAYSRDIVDRKLPNKSDDLRSTLSEAMTDQCEGQFLWLKMQEKSLGRWMNKKQLQHTIKETPAELDRLYDRSWQRITQSREWKGERIYALLRWAAFALRPLTVCEVTEAVLIDESEDLPIEDLPDAVDDDYIDSGIVGLCGPLLEVRGQDSDTSAGLRTVHLTHFSVKQYLLCNLPMPGWIRENERLRGEYQNTLLAKACLYYINFRRVWREAPDN